MYDEAASSCEASLEAWRSLLGAQVHPVLATVLNNLGVISAGQQQSAKAIAYYQQASAVLEEVRGRGSGGWRLGWMGCVMGERGLGEGGGGCCPLRG